MSFSYHFLKSTRFPDEPKLRMAMAAMSDPSSNATEVAGSLGITRSSLYDYVNGDGSLKELGKQLLNTRR